MDSLDNQPGVHADGARCSLPNLGRVNTLVRASRIGTDQANRNFGATTWTSVPSQSRTYSVAIASLCG